MISISSCISSGNHSAALSLCGFTSSRHFRPVECLMAHKSPWFIHIVNISVLRFHCGKLFQCLDTQTSVYSSLSWWTLELFPHFDSYKQCCYTVHAHVLTYKYALSSLGYIPRSKITVLHAYFILKFSWNCRAVLLSGCTASPAKYEGFNFLISSAIRVIVSFIVTIVLYMQWYLLNFILISLITNNFEHLFMYWLVTSTCFEKCLLRTLAHF